MHACHVVGGVVCSMSCCRWCGMHACHVVGGVVCMYVMW